MTEMPEAAKPLLDAYVEALRRDLPDLITGVYVHGSIVLDAFNPRSSDVDVVTVVSRKPTSEDCDRLKAIHERLKAEYPKPLLEVSYLQRGDLGKSEKQIEPHPDYHDGVFDASGHHDENCVTWWLLEYKGIALYGSIPDFPVDWDALVAETHENMNRYWARFTRDPMRMAWLIGDFGVQWAVLGVLRQYYTFVEHDITSKDGAGRYALDRLPGEWRKLVQEALNIRQAPFESAYRSRVVRAFEAWRFLRYVIDKSNGLFA